MNRQVFIRNYERLTNNILFLEAKISKIREKDRINKENIKNIEKYSEDVDKYRKLRYILVTSYNLNHQER